MNEDYKLNILKLALDGLNWVTYRDRMKYALDTRGWSDHLVTDKITQAYKDAGDVGGIKPEACWKGDEALVRQLIVASVSDSVFNRIKGSANAKSVWDELKKTFEGRTRSLLVDLGRKLQNTKCGEDDDVRAHFEALANFRKQLAAMGQSISNNQYTNALLSSLPPSYDANISIITTNADMSSTTITSNTVVRIITDKYDKRLLKKTKPKSTQEDAFATEAQKTKSKKNKRDIKCFNCHKKGHMKSDFWAKGGGKEGQGPKKKKTGASDDAAAADEKGDEKTTNDIEAWAVLEEIGQEHVAKSSYGPTTAAEEACNKVEAKLYDSGASRHMSPFRLTTYHSIPPHPIFTADKHMFHAEGVGNLQIEVPNGKTSTPILLKDTLYAPQIGLTIVSVGRIANAGYSVSFENDCCSIRKGQDEQRVGSIPANGNGLYKVKHVLMANAAVEQVYIHTLHRQLRHVSFDMIRNLVRTNAVTGLQIIDDGSPFSCDSCAYAKMTRKNICKEHRAPLATAFGDEIHTDVWGGPSTLLSLGGRKYYVSFTDDYSRYTCITLLHTKDEAFDAYKAFTAWAKTQHNIKIKQLRSDRGGEFTGNDFTKFLEQQGTERRLTTHNTPQHNGIAESLNRRIFERVCAMLHAAELPKNLWGEAVNHAVWLKNRTSTRVLGNVTPFERLYGEKPNLGGVPEWGQRVWVHNNAGSKLDAWATEARWVGFDSDSPHAHRVYWMGKNSISVERNIKFVPVTVSVYTPPPSYDSITAPTTIQPSAPVVTQPTAPTAITPSRMAPVIITLRPTFTRRATVATQTPASSSILPPAIPPQPVSQSESNEEMVDDEKEETDTFGRTPQAPKKKKKKDTEPSQATRRSERIPKLSNYIKRLAAGKGTTGAEFDTIDSVFCVELDGIIAAAIHEAEGDPKTLSEAQTRSDWPLWKAAMDHELETLEQAGTWETVPRPLNKNVVGSKWVFQIKRNADGKIEKYKARLVARGFTQVYGVDYFDTFSPVTKLSSIRTLLAIAARNNWEIESFNFNGVYLNGELNADKVIYMQAPPGYNSQGDTSVKRLKKSLYGLKQAGRRWYDTLTRALIDLGFRTSQADPGVFYAHVEDHVLILAIHVDDCIFTGDSAKLIAEYKIKLNECYALTDLGPVHWLLGIKIMRNRKMRTISLSQKSYIDSILNRFALVDAKALATPIVPGAVYS